LNSAPREGKVIGWVYVTYRFVAITLTETSTTANKAQARRR